MLGAFPVGHLHMWSVPNGLRDPAFQVVDHHPLRYTPEKLKCVAVATQPGLYFLVENKLNIRIPAPLQLLHKRPGFAQLAFRIPHLAHVTKINLRLFPWFTLLACEGLHRLRIDLPRQPQYRGVAPSIPLLLRPLPVPFNGPPVYSQVFPTLPVTPLLPA